MSQLTLYADHGCPFAHRVLAMLEHLGLDYELCAVPVGSKPAGLSVHSPSERIPLLVADELVLTESRVMVEYLAERFGHGTSYPDDVGVRARHRLATTLVDDWLSPRLAAPLRDSDCPRFAEAVEVFADAVEMPVRVSLFAIQIAPIWQRLSWLRPDSDAVSLIAARPRLASWLDAILELPCMVATTPARDELLADARRAIAAGMTLSPVR